MFKKDFPYFKNSQTIYLDNGATTQKPKSVIDSQVEYYETYCANTHRSNFGHANKATQEFEKTRVLLKEFINAQSAHALALCVQSTGPRAPPHPAVAGSRQCRGRGNT